MRRPRLAATLALLTLLAACGGGSGDDAEAGAEPSAVASAPTRAAEDLFVGRPAVTSEPDGKSATLVVTTNKKVACKVVFGTTEAVSDGEASDTDMADGAHTTHKAVMTDLEPDTEYYYRVEGTDTDGLAYASELATFRTASGEDVESLGKNIAPDAEVEKFSSEYSEAYQAANAIDGDPATEWSTSGDGDEASITLDLGRIVNLAGVGFRTRSMADGTAIIQTFTVTGDDGKTRGPFTLGAGLTAIKLELRTRTLRFDAVKTTGGNTGAVEIEAYEAPKATAGAKPKDS
jgi:hypothetical protein